MRCAIAAADRLHQRAKPAISSRVARASVVGGVATLLESSTDSLLDRVSEAVLARESGGTPIRGYLSLAHSSDRSSCAFRGGAA